MKSKVFFEKINNIDKPSQINQGQKARGHL